MDLRLTTMVFNQLAESAERGELVLVEGGLARFYVRRDGIATLSEILVLPPCQGQGIGTALLETVMAQARARGAHTVQARCPASLRANDWYRARGFRRVGTSCTRRGSEVILWQITL